MGDRSSTLLWSIGSADGISDDLVESYDRPDLVGEVIWRAGALEPQKWPRFHASEADPDGGYRFYRHTILFTLDHPPRGSYLLCIHYLVTTARRADLQLVVNGVAGRLFLHPQPSQAGRALTMAELHAAIGSEGVVEAVIPSGLLHQGENRLELVAVDGGDRIVVRRPEAVKRLDRIASAAGFHYRWIAFSEEAEVPDRRVRRATVRPSVLYRRAPDGRLVECCHLHLELNGPVEPATLRLEVEEGNRREEILLQVPGAPFGHLQLPFDLFDGEGEVAYRITGALGGQPVDLRGAFRRRRKWKVYVAPHVHTDIGYTHRQWEVAERLCRNLDAALQLVSREGSEPPSFAYHLDAAWALEQYLATRGRAARHRLAEAIRSGRIGVSGTYADLLTHYAGLEDLIRNISRADHLLRCLDARTSFAAAVDVPSLAGSLPAVLEGAGIRYLVHASNQDRGPFRLNGGLHRLSPYYWEGTHGGRVLVWLSRMYCELRKVCGSPPMLPAAERGLEMWLDEYEHEGYAPDAVLLYGQEADNTDLDPQPAAFIREWNRAYAYPCLIACTVSDFFEYVERSFGPALRRVKGDGGAYWEDGVGSSIVPSIAVRQAQAALPAAERLEALAVLHHDEAVYPLEQFDEAWRQTLLYDEHTWGAFLSVREPDALLTRDQWEVKEGFARESLAWARRLLHGAAVRHSLSWSTDGREVVVYNPHSWPVSGSFLVEIEPDEVPVDPSTGEAVPLRRVRETASQAVVEIWVDGLPGLSYRRFPLKRSPGKGDRPSVVRIEHAAPLVLENRYHRLVIDPADGRAISWVDRELGRELVDQSDPWGLGRLIYARGGENTRLVSNRATLPEGDPELLAGFRLRECLLRRDPLGTEVELRGEVPFGTLHITWSLPERARWWEVRYRYLKEDRREKEAVYVAFPLDLPGARVASDGHLGWVDWQDDLLPGGCREWLPLQTGILLSHPEASVFIASPEIPLFTVGSVVRGRWPREMELAGGRIFSYVLNNYWETNYKASQGGEISFRYRLASGREIRPEQAYRLGWESRQGLYGHRISFQDFREPRPPYRCPEGGTLARVGNEGVVLSTMTGAREGRGFILRLREVSGRDQRAPIAFPGRSIARAWLTDLLEREQAELPVEPGGTLQVPVPAWGLVTVRVELASAEEGTSQ